MTDETIKSLVRHMGEQIIESETGKAHSAGVANMYVKALIREKNAYKDLCEEHGLKLTKNPHYNGNPNGASHVAQ